MLIYSTIVPSSTTFIINEIIDPNVDNISKVNDFLSNIQPKDIDDAVLILLANDYIGKLISLFEKYEQDTNQVTLLRSLNGILHILLSWSNTTIIKEFLKEQYVVGFLGILEHDSLKKKILFREQFKTLKRLNLDSSMMDEEMFHKIQETENLEFLKSQMTSHYQPKRYINLIKLVDKLISWNRLDIIQWIQYDIVYVRYILNLLSSEDQVNIDKCNYVDFLYFILSSSKMEMQPFALATLIRLLLDHGLLNVIHFLVPNENGDIRFKIVFILNLVMEYDLVMVQHYILDQIDKNKHIPTLLQTILEQWTKEDNIDLAKSFYEITQYLLGLIPPLQIQPKAVNKETFFSEDPTLNNIIKLFYSRISTSLFCAFNWIEIKPIHVNGYKDVLEMTENQVIIYGNICELLENMISNNNLPSKTVVQESHFFVRMVQLFRCRDYTVKLKNLRFFMACVRLKEEEYHKLLVRSNFIAAIIGLLLNDELQQDDTLYIESQALFNYIHQNNITILRNHIISEYSISIRPLIASDIIQDPQKPFSENMTN